jgi:hypothetical protein
MRNVSDKTVEKIKTYLLNNAFFFENRAVCEIKGKYVVESDRAQMRRE